MDCEVFPEGRVDRKALLECVRLLQRPEYGKLFWRSGSDREGS